MKDSADAAHPAALRWGVLALSCLLMVGNYYCYDNPAALKTQLQQHFHALSRDDFEWRFNLLYTLYAIPNMALPFFGGAIVDRYGTAVTLVGFSTLILVGQMVFAAGSSFSSFNLMLVGRFIVGLGGESLQVAQETLVVAWFKHEELAFALGLNLSVARLGSVINNELSPLIAAAADASVALWTGVLLCLLSSTAVLLVIWLDRRATRTALSPASQRAESAAAHSVKLSDVKQFGPLFWLLALSAVVIYGCIVPFISVASSVLIERDYFKAPPAACLRCGDGVYQEETLCKTIDLTHCPESPPYAWPLPRLSANCSISAPEDQWQCYSPTAAAPLIDDTKINCDDEAWQSGPFTETYCAKKAVAEARAATPMSIPYMISATISPFLGLLVDRVGLRAFLIAVAPLVLVVAHLLLAWTTVSPYTPMIMLGVAYSVFAAVLWPAVPLVVEEHHVGTAYGVITAAMNTGLTIFPLAVAALYERAHLYIPGVGLFFAVLALAGCLVGVVISVVDWRSGGVLNAPGARAATAAKPTETTPLLL